MIGRPYEPGGPGASEPGQGPILVLGGTAEGRELAAALTAAGQAVISSLAGRVSAPRRPVGEVRVGGFGGAPGLADYLAQQRISRVVDATHPFAARITANAAAACAATGTPLLVLRRPPWTPVDGDHWITVPDLDAAATELHRFSSRASVLLAIGRQGIGAFRQAPHRFWLRAIDPPDEPRPARCELILDRGPFTLGGELELFRRLSIDLLVTKNSGGPLTAAKLTAARRLDLPVLVIDRPAPPEELTTVSTVQAALTWAGTS